MIIGEIVKGGALEYMGPKNVVATLKPGISVWTYVTAGAAGVTLVLSVVFGVIYLVGRRKKTTAAVPEEQTGDDPSGNS